jgi:hypothetical protein
VFALNSYLETREKESQKNSSLHIILDTAERMMEIFAFKDSKHFRFFAEEEFRSKNRKRGLFSLARASS